SRPIDGERRADRARAETPRRAAAPRDFERVGAVGQPDAAWRERRERAHVDDRRRPVADGLRHQRERRRASRRRDRDVDLAARGPAGPTGAHATWRETRGGEGGPRSGGEEAATQPGTGSARGGTTATVPPAPALASAKPPYGSCAPSPADDEPQNETWRPGS